MAHIDEFWIKNFRGLRDVKIEGIGQVNLFVGNNNSGKTSVLEALSLFSDPLNIRRWLDTGSQRDVTSIGLQWSPGIDRIMWLFSQGSHAENLSKTQSEISFSASGNIPIKRVSANYEIFNEIVNMNIPFVFTASGDDILLERNEARVDEREEEIEGIRIHISVSGKRVRPTLFEDDLKVDETLTYIDNPFLRQSQTRPKTALVFPAQMVNPFSHRTNSLTSMLWSEVVKADLKEETIRLLQHFDSGILDVDFISLTERRQLLSIKHAKLGRVPLYAFGDGLRRVFTLATTIPRVRGGILLIDELETAIHAKALEKTFEWLVKACVYNDVQLVATTHSLEALDAVMEVSREIADLVVYRLEQEKEQTIAKRFDKATILRLREELGMELRY